MWQEIIDKLAFESMVIIAQVSRDFCEMVNNNYDYSRVPAVLKKWKRWHPPGYINFGREWNHSMYYSILLREFAATDNLHGLMWADRMMSFDPLTDFIVYGYQRAVKENFVRCLEYFRTRADYDLLVRAKPISIAW